MALEIISAGAGSGKTHSLMSRLVGLLQRREVRPGNIIATTFTEKAAAELRERVRTDLLKEGEIDAANELPNALIGTVHSIGTRLLRRFAFEAGVSPQLDIVAEDNDHQTLFNRSLSTILTDEVSERMDVLCERLGLSKRSGNYDWRRDIQSLCDLARANDISPEMWQHSREHSFLTLLPFLGERSTDSRDIWNQRFDMALELGIQALSEIGDTTKTTAGVIEELKKIQREWRAQGFVAWHQWAKIGKMSPAKKAGDAFEPLREVAKSHDTHPDFHDDIRGYITLVFDLAEQALTEYSEYKRQRGLIDYTDMEVLVRRLLQKPDIRAVLAQEIDLLMVDEFQDTSPIQLDIFTQLSRLSKHSVWVGDPKQSIYGFRGADPRLMRAVIEAQGGTSDILEHSWRSRPDIVGLTNEIFTRAFADMPREQVVLSPKRTDLLQQLPALQHWHIEPIEDPDKRAPGGLWTDIALARSIRSFLEAEAIIKPKDEPSTRPARAGDIAVLCRSNRQCTEMAQALNKSGLKAAIARPGLLDTAEVALVLACLRYLHSRRDTLAIAEIKMLARGENIEHIMAERLDFLQGLDETNRHFQWAEDQPVLQRLNTLRSDTRELSAVEILNLVVEELDIRRRVAAWGNVAQRLGNLDTLRRFTLKYEEACTRNRQAASLAGFLLWVTSLGSTGQDEQSAGESPDAVRVMTYHKSKGLEFPVTVCHSLDEKLKERLWDFHLEHSRENLNLDNVLDGLWIRFWVNPYADQSAKTPLVLRLADSDYQARAARAARLEEARLLYVGITRARDYLVLPTMREPNKWLNRTFGADEDAHLLDANGGATPFHPLEFDVRRMQFPRELDDIESDGEQITFLEARAGQKEYPNYLIGIEGENPKFTIKSLRQTSFITEPPRPTPEDLVPVFRTMRGMILGDDIGLPNREASATALRRRYDTAGKVSPEDLLSTSEAWWQFAKQHFGTAQVHRLYPVRHHVGERLFETDIELLFETPDRVTIVLLHQFPVAKTAAAQVGRVGSWLSLTTEAVTHIFPGRQVVAAVLFPLAGQFIEVDF